MKFLPRFQVWIRIQVLNGFLFLFWLTVSLHPGLRRCDGQGSCMSNNEFIRLSRVKSYKRWGVLCDRLHHHLFKNRLRPTKTLILHDLSIFGWGSTAHRPCNAECCSCHNNVHRLSGWIINHFECFDLSSVTPIRIAFNHNLELHMFSSTKILLDYWLLFRLHLGLGKSELSYVISVE